MDATGWGLSAIGLVELADSCVNCFRYVRIGKKFGEDHQRARLGLDILQLRLSRWAEAIRDSKPSPSPVEAEQTKVLLEGILNTFKDAEKVSSKGKWLFSRHTDVVDLSNPTNTDQELVRSQTTMRQMALRDQKQSSVKEKVPWVINKRYRFERLLNELTAFIDGLVELYPAARERQEELAGEQTAKLQEVGGDAIKILEDAAAGRDLILQSSIRKSLEKAQKRSYHGNTTTTDVVRVRYGDELIDDGMSTIVDGHLYSGNVVSGKAIAHFGNSYGGDSILDR